MIDLEKRAKAWDEFSGESMEWTVSNTFNTAYALGVRDGAASVDRVEIVREAFKGLALELGHGQLPDPNEFYYATSLATAMESVIASMEKGNERS